MNTSNISANPYILSGNDALDDVKRDLSDVVNIYYRALNWSLSWIRQMRADVPQNAIDGFFLSYQEMDVLRLDLKDILMAIAKRSFSTAMSMPPPLDYWSSAINRYAFRVTADDLEWSTPGFEIPDIWRIERLQFEADPRFLPMSNILEAFRGYALPLGFKPENLLFSHDGLLVEEASTLINNVMATGTNTPLVMIELQRWRDYIFEQIGSASSHRNIDKLNTIAIREDKPLMPPAIENTTAEIDNSIDAQLVGHMVSRAEIARIVDRTSRTIKNWDAKGEAPNGHVWHPADETTSNGALYDISKNWNTLLSLSARPRDLERDRQLAQELLEAKQSDDSESNA